MWDDLGLPLVEIFTFDDDAENIRKLFEIKDKKSQQRVYVLGGLVPRDRVGGGGWWRHVAVSTSLYIILSSHEPRNSTSLGPVSGIHRRLAEFPHKWLVMLEEHCVISLVL